MKKTLVSFTLLVCSCCGLYGQDLEKLIQTKPKDLLKPGIKVSGMAGANFVYYQANGLDSPRNIPFNTLFTGNLMIDLFGKVKMPFMFSLSNQNINWSHPFDKKHQFTQPFNRFVIKPTYKGFTLHLGVCSLNFSPLTLAGHRYDGVGLEYKPKDKPYYFGLMMGNLRRAIRVDSSFETNRSAYMNNIPSYRRPGMGLQFGLRHNEDKAELTFFTAKDVKNSLPYDLDAYGTMPEQNAVVSLKGSKVLVKKWVIDAEMAVSGLSQDTRAPRDSSAGMFRNYLGVLPSRTSTVYKKAIKSAVTYRGKTYNAGLEFSRIDPGYRTLGAYYFVNDLQSYTARIAGQLLQGKLNASVNAGLQHDNVQKQKLKTLKRWVGAANITYVPAAWAQLMLSYSNFTSYSNLRPVYDYLRQVTPYQTLDTLNFRQINQNIQAGANFTLPSRSEAITQGLGLQAVLQRGTDQQGSQRINNNLSNISLDYSYSVKPLKLNTTLSMYLSQSDIFGLTSTQWGPSLGISKGFGKQDGMQWKTQANLTYTTGSMDGVSQKMLNARAGASASLTKQLNLSTNIIYLNRSNVSIERSIPSFNELTATLGLIYTFSVL